MFSKLRPQSSYGRNVITLMTGTSLAQAIPIAISPILTRLYSPEEFGLAALYMSCVAVLALVATGRYELAIGLPATDKEAAHVVTLTLKIAVMISILLYLPIFLFGTYAADLIGDPKLEPWFYLLPVSVLITASFNVFQYWCNRRSQYRAMSTNRVQNATLSSSFNVALGLGNKSGGMILGPAIGQALAAALIGRRVWAQNSSLLSTTTKREECAVARRYADHPKHIAPAQLLGTIALQIPVFMIGSNYSLAMLGFFSMAYRLVSLPSSLIAGAIGDVYRQRISEAYSEHGEFRSIFVNTLKNTTLLALLPFSIVYFAAPFLFELIFGSTWRTAGEYAQILVVAAFFQFIFTPIDKGAVVVGATRYILVWHSARLLFLLSLLYASGAYEIEIENVLWCFVSINSALYFVEGVVGYRLAGK